MTFERWWDTRGNQTQGSMAELLEACYEAGKAAATAWIPVTEQLPAPGIPVIALVNPNEYGKIRRIRAMWAPAKTLEQHEDAEDGIYDEATDKFYCEEGWYETNEFEEVHWNVHGNVTHWQPLPEIPEELKVKQGDNNASK